MFEVLGLCSDNVQYIAGQEHEDNVRRHKEVDGWMCDIQQWLQREKKNNLAIYMWQS